MRSSIREVIITEPLNVRIKKYDKMKEFISFHMQKSENL